MFVREAHTIEILERGGSMERSWSAFCLDCGWMSEDSNSRLLIEDRAKEHREGKLQPWTDPSMSAGWESAHQDRR